MNAIMNLEIDLNKIEDVSAAINLLINIEENLKITGDMHGFMDVGIDEDPIDEIQDQKDYEAYIKVGCINFAKINSLNIEAEAARISRINFISEVLLPHYKAKCRHIKVAELVTELNRLETR